MLMKNVSAHTLSAKVAASLGLPAQPIAPGAEVEIADGYAYAAGRSQNGRPLSSTVQMTAPQLLPANAEEQQRFDTLTYEDLPEVIERRRQEREAEKRRDFLRDRPRRLREAQARHAAEAARMERSDAALAKLDQGFSVKELLAAKQKGKGKPQDGAQ